MKKSVYSLNSRNIFSAFFQCIVYNAMASNFEKSNLLFYSLLYYWMNIEYGRTAGIFSEWVDINKDNIDIIITTIKWRVNILKSIIFGMSNFQNKNMAKTKKMVHHL